MLKYHKADDSCRLCKHTFVHHYLYTVVQQGGMQQEFVLPLDMVPCDSFASSSLSGTFTGRCGCIEFEPSDNLEYLELKADQSDEKTAD